MNILFLPVSFAKHFENIEQLSRQQEVRYGLVRFGATEAFFTVPNYIKLCYLIISFFSNFTPNLLIRK